MFSFLALDLGSSFWGMVLVLASTNLLTARIAAGCLAVALVVVLFVAKNVSAFMSSTSLLILCNLSVKRSSSFVAKLCSTD